MVANSMESTPKPRRRKSRSDFANLRSLLAVRPGTSTGQVAAAGGEIQANLANGMKLREVWEAATLDGLEIPYPQFRVYVSRLRRKQKKASESRPQPPPTQASAGHEEADPSRSDPFRNLREQREKKQQSGFEYDPFSINKNFID
jgi:hypothetical protein